MDRKSELKRAQDLATESELDQAYVIADRWLKENPEDPQFLTIMVYIMLQSEKTTIAYNLARRATQLMPREPGAWMNLGMAAGDLKLYADAERSYKKGLKYCKNDKQAAMLNVNLSAILIDSGRFVEAEPYCLATLKADPDHAKARGNLGFCQLAQGHWGEGWDNYFYTLGSGWRPRNQYADEPEWDGKGKGTILVYAEQGLGDVISAASMIPDMLEWCEQNDSRLILEVNKRLEGLFKRMFPGVSVYGTRRVKEMRWKVQDTKIDYSFPIMQLGQYFRRNASDFPGTAYIKPDPDRELQWRALFDSKKKPVIGIAWRGGIEKTGARFRQLDLEQLLPLFKSVDAHWVSLQYKPAGKEIAAFKKKHPEIDLVEYAHGTLTNDYDDTVAMVSALDMVVAMHTTVVHAAGGLGIPCWTFVPKNSQWRYGYEGEDFVWARSVRIIRQNERGRWDDVIDQTAEDLNVRIAGICETAGKATRHGPVRRNRKKVRANGQSDHRQAGDRHPT